MKIFLLYVLMHTVLLSSSIQAVERFKASKKQLEATTQKFIDNLAAQAAPPLYTLSPAQARKVLNDLQVKSPVRKSTAYIQDLSISTTAGNVSLTIVRPHNTPGKLPVIMYFHGGGWILGNKHTHDHLIRQLANNTHAAVVFVNYTLSPEAPYPTALKQAYAATEYIVRHGAKHNLDPNTIAVAGDSVGGTMATVVALLAKKQGLKLVYQLLFYPVTDARMNTDSYTTFAQGPWLTKPAMQWFWNAYQPNKQARTKPTLSPLRASIDQLRGLPPTLIITAENDVLRDEGEAYAHKLMQADVPVTAVRYLGTIHDFVMLHALANTPATKSALELASTTLRKALHSPSGLNVQDDPLFQDIVKLQSAVNPRLKI